MTCHHLTAWCTSVGEGWMLEFIPPATEEMEKPFKMEIVDCIDLLVLP